MAVEEIPAKPRRSTTEFSHVRIIAGPDPAPPDVPAPRAEQRQMGAMLEAYRMLGFALSARALLLLAIVGAFVLACLAAIHETQATLFVLIAWCVLTVGPIVFLEVRRRE